MTFAIQFFLKKPRILNSVRIQNTVTTLHKPTFEPYQGAKSFPIMSEVEMNDLTPSELDAKIRELQALKERAAAAEAPQKESDVAKGEPATVKKAKKVKEGKEKPEPVSTVVTTNPIVRSLMVIYHVQTITTYGQRKISKNIPWARFQNWHVVRTIMSSYQCHMTCLTYEKFFVIFVIFCRFKRYSIALGMAIKYSRVKLYVKQRGMLARVLYRSEEGNLKKFLGNRNIQ